MENTCSRCDPWCLGVWGMSITSAIRPDDVLLALLALGPDAETRLTGVSEIIHKTVFHLKTDYPEAFAEFIFSSSTSYPYSEQLASSLHSLQWCRLIGMENPDFRVYFVRDSVRRVFQEVVQPRLPESILSDLAAASRRFWQKAGEPETGDQ